MPAAAIEVDHPDPEHALAERLASRAALEVRVIRDGHDEAERVAAALENRDEHAGEDGEHDPVDEHSAEPAPETRTWTCRPASVLVRACRHDPPLCGPRDGAKAGNAKPPRPRARNFEPFSAFA